MDLHGSSHSPSMSISSYLAIFPPHITSPLMVLTNKYIPTHAVVFFVSFRSQTTKSQAHPVASGPRTLDVLTFGPLGVLPAFRRQGLAAELVKQSLRRAQEMGCRAVVIQGRPDRGTAADV